MVGEEARRRVQEVAWAGGHAGADVEDPLAEVARAECGTDGTPHVADVHRLVGLVAALRDHARLAASGVLDELPVEREGAMPGRLARPVDRGEAQRHDVHRIALPVVAAELLAADLEGAVEVDRPEGMFLGDRLQGRRGVLAADLAVDRLRAGEDDALEARRSRHLEHVQHSAHRDVPGEAGIGLGGARHQRRQVSDVRDLVIGDRRLQRPLVGDLADHDLDRVADVPDQRQVEAVVHEDRPQPVRHQQPRQDRAVDAQPAADQRAHRRPDRSPRGR
jgi:hypothetical protein